MDIESLRSYCLAMPGVTDGIQWGHDLVFKVGGKMFAVANLEPGDAHWLSFKCTAERFADLTERVDIVPAPYLARHHWVSLMTSTALGSRELKSLLREAYEQVLAKLPKKVRANIS